jgi:hypothetical protein
MANVHTCSVCAFSTDNLTGITNHIQESNTHQLLFQCPGAGCTARFCLASQTAGEDGHFQNCDPMYKWKSQKKWGLSIDNSRVRNASDITLQRAGQIATFTSGVATAAQPLANLAAPTAASTTRSPKKMAVRPKTTVGEKRKALQDFEGEDEDFSEGDELDKVDSAVESDDEEFSIQKRPAKRQRVNTTASIVRNAVESDDEQDNIQTSPSKRQLVSPTANRASINQRKPQPKFGLSLGEALTRANDEHTASNDNDLNPPTSRTPTAPSPVSIAAVQTVLNDVAHADEGPELEEGWDVPDPAVVYAQGQRSGSGPRPYQGLAFVDPQWTLLHPERGWFDAQGTYHK